MKLRIPIATTTAALVAVSTTAFASGQSAENSNQNSGQSQSRFDHSRSDQRQNQGQQGQRAKAPNGFILLEENTVYMMAREPQQHLLRAHEQLQANNPKAAAAELRLAGAYLKMQEARPGDEGKNVLSHWQQQIDQLAGRVEKGNVKSQDLIHTANGANYALAKYFDQRAKDELGEQHKQVQAGYDLQAAADCFEQSLLWSNPSGQSSQASQDQQGKNARSSPIRPEEVQALRHARVAADRLISAENLASNQSGQGEAQLASGKTGPGHEQQGSSNASSNDANSSQSAQKAADELGKAIDSIASQFQPRSDQNGSHNSTSNSHPNSK